MDSSGGAASAASSSQSTSNTSLDALLTRRQQLEEDLKQIEKQIYDLEESYLEDTSAYGNVIKGWEGYLNSKVSTKSSSHRGDGDKKKGRIAARDRLFSASSSTAPRPEEEGPALVVSGGGLIADDMEVNAGVTGMGAGGSATQSLIASMGDVQLNPMPTSSTSRRQSSRRTQDEDQMLL